MSEQTIGTTCVQGGYHPGDAEPRQVPIYQSTTWKYDTSEHMGKLFDLEESGYFYCRQDLRDGGRHRRDAHELGHGCELPRDL